MRCHAATHCEDTLCNSHTAKILRRGFYTHKHDFLFLLRPGFGLVSKEYYLAGSRARRCGQTLCHDFGCTESFLGKHRVKKLVEFLRLHAGEHSFLVDHVLTEEIHCDLYHCSAGTLAIAGLKHPELAVLDCELHVLHIAVVFLQTVCYSYKLGGADWHRLLKRRIFRCTLLFAYALQFGPTARTLDSDLLRCAYACYHILALSVDEVFTVKHLLTGSSVTAECHACSRIFAHVAVNHSLDIDGSTPLFGYLVHAAINDRTLVHPAVKHSADSTPELFPGAVGEIFSGVFLDSLFKQYNKFLEILHIKLCIELHAFLLLDFLHYSLERIDVGLAFGLHAKHNVAIHLHETAVAVPCKARIAAFLCKRSHCGIVHTEIEHRIHHAGHRSTRSAAHRHKKRIGRIVKFLTCKALDVGDSILHVILNSLYYLFLTTLCVFVTHLCCDCKSRGYRHTE